MRIRVFVPFLTKESGIPGPRVSDGGIERQTIKTTKVQKVWQEPSRRVRNFRIQRDCEIQKDNVVEKLTMQYDPASASALLSPHPVLCACNLHQQLLVLDRNPTREYLHSVFKIAIQ